VNQLKSWGFSAQWWRGERGEYWVIGQGLMFLGITLLPVYPAARIVTGIVNRFSGGSIDPSAPIWQYTSWGLTGFLGTIAAVFLLGGSINLGTNITPLPHPKDESYLVTAGVYSLVRHPIYSGVIFLTLAYSCWQGSLSHLIGAFAFFLFFDAKARKEESWLREKFTDYDTYRSQVKKLIPWIY